MGGHGHDHGHRSIEEMYPGMKVPDASSYKLEDAPPLLRIQEDLAKKGLKDPWLRNHVWKYHPKYGTEGQRWRGLIFRGWKVGLAAFLITIGVEKALGIDYTHGHHEEHGEKEHH